MGLFTKKLDACPICGVGVERALTAWLAHNEASHAVPAPDGRGDFIWRCGCGEYDGAWDQPHSVAAALTMHFKQKHHLYMT
jgi:hypothetical protein